MDIAFLIVLSTAFVLGLEHSFEPDHIVAVSTIIAQSKGLTKSVVTGTLWGLGHTVSLLIVGTLLILLRLQFLAGIVKVFEMLVGVMLILLGLWAILRVRKLAIHFHVHVHDGRAHAHLHSHRDSESHEHKHIPFSIGLVHGLAGSGALVILVMATMKNFAQALSFMAAFGVGLIVAMSLISSVISLPTRVNDKFAAKVGFLFPLSVGILSVVWGILIVLGLT